MEKIEKGVQSLLKILIKWTPSGAGVTLTVQSFWDHQWTQAVLFSSLTACTSVWVKFSGEFMNQVEQEAAKRGGRLGQWVFVVGGQLADLLRNELTKTWHTLTSGFEEKYYKRLEYICRNYETQGLDKYQVLKLKRVFVPLKIAQKSVSQISPNLIQSLRDQGNLSGQMDIGDILVLMESDRTLRHFAILGAPGSGKTTLLRFLTLAYVTRTQRELHPRAPRWIPVLLYLRDIYETVLQTPDITLPKLITQWVEQLAISDPLTVPPDWFSNKLQKRQCLVMLDGLDEVADQQERQQVSRWVDAQMARYPELPILLTSRPFGYKTAELRETVSVLEVQPFTLDQMQKFIRNWYLATEIRSQQQDDPGVESEARRQAEDLIRRIKNSSPLAAMAVNPLLLTMIATVHRRGNVLPGKRVELYKEICQVLLEKRQRAKEIEDLLTGFSASQKQSVLQVLALELMEKRTRSFTLEQIGPTTKAELTTIFGQDISLYQFIQEIKNVSGLLIMKEQESVYEFVHLSFQEYLAAVEIKGSSQEERLIKVFEDPDQLSWWSETIRLYAAQSDASNLISAALREPTTVEVLSLGYDCLEEKYKVKPEVEDLLLRKLEKGLESRTFESFKLAAKVLLARHLNKLLRVDEERSIDLDFITCAEYQLSLNDEGGTGVGFIPRNWILQPGPRQSRNVLRYGTEWFPNKEAKKPVTEITFEAANQFCRWLSLNDPLPHELEDVMIYRLPSETEAGEHPAESVYGRLSCWINRNSDPSSGIRVVRAKIPPRYKQLYSYLSSDQWQQADQETAQVMLQVAGQDRNRKGYLTPEDIDKFPCEDLQVIDQLWVQTSGGRFGFSIQKQIWIQVGGKLKQGYDEEIWQRFADLVGWRVRQKWLSYEDLTFRGRALGHLLGTTLVLRTVGGFFSLMALFSRVSSLASRLVKCSRS